MRASRPSTQLVAEPLVHARALGAASVVALGLAGVAGLLWTAAAFSSHDSWAYHHLAGWITASVIGAGLVGGVIAGALSSTRGSVAGAVNGATTGAVLVVLTGGIALLALAVNGSLDQRLLVANHDLLVEFTRPYLAFWAGAGALALGAAGGAAGGMLPRRLAAYPSVGLSPVATIRSASLDATTVAPTKAAS